jgi:hypothetical protein
MSIVLDGLSRLGNALADRTRQRLLIALARSPGYPAVAGDAAWGVAYTNGLLGDLAYRRGDLETAAARNAVRAGADGVEVHRPGRVVEPF